MENLMNNKNFFQGVLSSCKVFLPILCYLKGLLLDRYFWNSLDAKTFLAF